MAQTSPTVPVKRLTPDQLSALPPIEDFSDLIDELNFRFMQLSRLTGEAWGWKHPRMLDYLRRCGIPNRYWLPLSRYKFLIEGLQTLIEELENESRGCRKI